MTNEWIRPAAAAAQFGVSIRTLERWAADRLIEKSRTGRIAHYRASDIADLIASGATPRRTLRVVAQTSAPAPVELGGIWRKASLR